MKVIVFSAHPDDGEAGAGGLCARTARAKHDVIIIHISKEVRCKKINGIPESQVRIAEAVEASKILGVRVEFLDYYMGECPVTVESSNVIEELLRKHKPDIVLTQWPIDSHPDHQAVGILPLRPYIWHKKFCLGFYEVYTGIQTMSFQPNRYIDISNFIEQKRESILAHKSQCPEKQIEIHEKINLFRGIEMGCQYAEAFHILGAEGATLFDKLFNDVRVYGESGGMEQFNFEEW